MHRKILGLMLMLGVIVSHGCTSGNAFSWWANPTIGTPDSPSQDITAQELAAKLSLQVVQDSSGIVRLGDTTNRVTIYSDPHGSVHVNGKCVCETGGKAGSAGKMRIPANLTSIISSSLTPVIASRRQDFDPIVVPTREKEPTTPRDTEPREVAKSLAGKVFVIDAGHGGKDPGALRLFYRRGDSRQRHAINQEKTVVLDVAQKVAARLRKAGARVVMTRDGDRFVELDTRAAISNRNRPLLFLSIHADSARNRSASGHSIFYPRRTSRGGRSCKVGNSIDHKMKAVTRNSRGVRQHSRNLRVLENTRSSALLIELGFMSNSRESAKLVTGSYRTKLANAIADGIIHSLGS